MVGMLDNMIEEEEEEEASLSWSSLKVKFFIRGFEVAQETRPMDNLPNHASNHFYVHTWSSSREKSWLWCKPWLV